MDLELLTLSSCLRKWVFWSEITKLISGPHGPPRRHDFADISGTQMEELAEASGSPRSILAHPRGRFGDCRFFHARKELKTKKGGVFEKARGV